MVVVGQRGGFADARARATLGRLGRIVADRRSRGRRSTVRLVELRRRRRISRRRAAFVLVHENHVGAECVERRPCGRHAIGHAALAGRVEPTIPVLLLAVGARKQPHADVLGAHALRPGGWFDRVQALQLMEANIERERKINPNILR